MVDLLRRDVVDGSAGGNFLYLGCVLRRVAADIRTCRAQDTRLAIGILGLARSGPVRLLGLAVDDKSWESV